VISRTRNFHTRTLAKIAQLVSFKENPPDNITYKSLPTHTQKIAIVIHVHAHEWLTLMSKVSRSTLIHRRKTTKQTKNKQQRHIENNDPRPTTPTTQWKVTREAEQEEESGMRGRRWTWWIWHTKV
jgi:hypothetical protein